MAPLHRTGTPHRLPVPQPSCQSRVMVALEPLLADLRAESGDLDSLVAALPDAAWAAATPAAGWTIAHQIAHLAWTDEVATTAITQPARFRDEVLAAAADDPGGFADVAAAAGATTPPQRLLGRWRAGRAALQEALQGVPEGARIVWFGPPMGAASMATARLMETWAHGQDVADALGVARLPTPRLRHVAHLGVRTRDFAYRIHDRTPPAEPIRVELHGPDGTIWLWGEDAATQSVTGSALDFCLLVTQRRHRADLGLVAVGADADEWLSIAQAFAGPPGPGRPAPDRP